MPAGLTRGLIGARIHPGDQGLAEMDPHEHALRVDHAAFSEAGAVHDPLRLETAAHWASTLADLEFYGLGKDYIEGYGPALTRVDLAETAAVTADAFPRASDLQIVLIGDASKIRDMAAKYGAVTEMKLSQPDFVPAQK